MRPNDNDFARARLMLAGPCPQSGTFMSEPDIRRRSPEMLTTNIAIVRGASFPAERWAEARRGDGQDLHDLLAASLDGLWVRFNRPERTDLPSELRAVWVLVARWEGAAARQVPKM